MKTSWIVYALCIYSVSGDIIFKRTGQPDTVKMECGEKTSNMDVEWTFEGVLILDINGRSGKMRKGKAPMVERAKLRDSMLEISSVFSSDAGQYICKVNRVEKQRHSLYIVEVSVTPDSVLNKGTVATLQCHLSGVEPLPKVTWLSPVGMVVDTGTVSLSPADVMDSGEWKCQITQGEKTHSEALIINVVPLVTTSPTTKHIGGQEKEEEKDDNPATHCMNSMCISSVNGDVILKRTGQPDTVKMECGVKTSNMDVEWTFTAVGTSQGLLILDINGRSGKMRKGNAPMVERTKLRDGILEISSVCISDAGQYICNVNRVEKQRHSLYIVEGTTPVHICYGGVL